MTVKAQRKMLFDNKCDCIVELTVLEQAMIWFSSKPQCAKKSIFMHGKYPAVSIFGEKIHVHRLIGLYLQREKLVRGLYVHHKDENKLNALSNNLEVVTSSAHQSHHNKNKTLSDSHKSKISESNRLRKGTKIKRKYNIDLKALRTFILQGWSINKIANNYGCDWSVIRARIFEHPDLLEPKP
jgi:hypothetical protein